MEWKPGALCRCLASIFMKRLSTGAVCVLVHLDSARKHLPLLPRRLTNLRRTRSQCERDPLLGLVTHVHSVFPCPSTCYFLCASLRTRDLFLHLFLCICLRPLTHAFIPSTSLNPHPSRSRLALCHFLFLYLSLSLSPALCLSQPFLPVSPSISRVI